MQESDYRHPHLVPNDLFDIVVEVLEWAKFISETRDGSDQKNISVIGWPQLFNTWCLVVLSASVPRTKETA